MTDSKDEKDALDRIARLPVTAERTGFSADEMIACAKCRRTNPPTRLKCFYCGAELELSDEQAARVRPAPRRLEAHENGFNVVVFGPAPDDSAAAAAARELRIDADFLAAVLAAPTPLPVVRAESAREAALISAAFSAHGIGSRTVADSELDASNPPRRLRSMSFDGETVALEPFNSGETERIAASGIRLIVVGAVFEKSVESFEKRKKGENRIVEAAETASDELLFDFYADGDPAGRRVLTRGFDFSCLGDSKSIVAAGNLRALVAKLSELAPSAVVSDDYLSVRGLLERVWESDQRRDSQGVRRQGFGRFGLTNVSTSSNAAQFTRFSRLGRQLL